MALEIDSPCSIYSRSAKQWLDGTIAKIYIDPATNKEWLVVKYGQNKSKKMQRLCNDLQAMIEETRIDSSPTDPEDEDDEADEKLMHEPEPDSTTSSYDDFEFDIEDDDVDINMNERRQHNQINVNYNPGRTTSYDESMATATYSHGPQDDDCMDSPNKKWNMYRKKYGQTAPYIFKDDGNDGDDDGNSLFIDNGQNSSGSSMFRQECLLKQTADYVNIVRTKHKIKFGWIGLSSPHSQIPPNSNLIAINREEFVIATEMREYKPYGGIYKYNIINKRWDFFMSYPRDIPFEKNGFHRISFDAKTNELWIYGLQQNEYVHDIWLSILLKINIKTNGYKIIPIPGRQSTGL